MECITRHSTKIGTCIWQSSKRYADRCASCKQYCHMCTQGIYAEIVFCCCFGLCLRSWDQLGANKVLCCGLKQNSLFPNIRSCYENIVQSLNETSHSMLFWPETPRALNANFVGNLHLCVPTRRRSPSTIYSTTFKSLFVSTSIKCLQ